MTVAVLALVLFWPLSKPQSQVTPNSNPTQSQRTINPSHQSENKTQHSEDNQINWSNWALVAVGTGGIWVANNTLKAIQRQGLSMRRQTTHLRNSVAAARQTVRVIRKQADLMDGQLQEMKESRTIETKTLLLQYRPKVIVRRAVASDFNVAELGKPANAKVQLTVVNTGGSAAHVTRGVAALWSALDSEGKTQIKKTGGNDLGQFTLQPGQEKRFELTMGVGVTNDIQWANYHAGIRTEPLRFIYLVGWINYVDDLSIPREAGFMRTYDAKKGKFVPVENSDEEYVD